MSDFVYPVGNDADMKLLVYPAVVYKDKDNGGDSDDYVIAIDELGIYTSGESVVDAYIRAKAHLSAIVDCAIKFECEINSPRDFNSVYKENSKSGKLIKYVLLVDALT